MHDPAQLHLPTGEFILVDLATLRLKLPHEARVQLDAEHASAAIAAILWARAYDSYEQREFFIAAVHDRRGFGIRRTGPLAYALLWLQREHAVIRWYADNAVEMVRVSVHDDEDRIFAIDHPLGVDGPLGLAAAVTQLREHVAAQGVRRRLHLVK